MKIGKAQNRFAVSFNDGKLVAIIGKHLSNNPPTEIEWMERSGRANGIDLEGTFHRSLKMDVTPASIGWLVFHLGKLGWLTFLWSKNGKPIAESG